MIDDASKADVSDPDAGSAPEELVVDATPMDEEGVDVSSESPADDSAEDAAAAVSEDSSEVSSDAQEVAAEAEETAGVETETEETDADAENDSETDTEVGDAVAEPEEVAVDDGAVTLGVVSDDSADDDDVELPPVELIEETPEEEDVEKNWYILKVQVNRERSICDALQRRVKVEGLENYFGEILVPTEDVREFTKAGKQRIVKRKLYPGYVVVNMAINDDTWFVVRETPGIGDFTGSAGKPTPMLDHEIQRILKATRKVGEDEEQEIKTTIAFKVGQRVRVKDGHFENFEGEVHTVDETHGRVQVMINIFGRPTPVELEHWQVEDI